jgi:hypothetical protein
LLPLFEKDSKKSSSPRRKGRRGSLGNDGKDDPNTVYGELKLSERLSLEIINLRKEKEL